jgi:hypothetical protein
MLKWFWRLVNRAILHRVLLLLISLEQYPACDPKRLFLFWIVVVPVFFEKAVTNFLLG